VDSQQSPKNIYRLKKGEQKWMGKFSFWGKWKEFFAETPERYFR
jgi:hypothetical protein